MRILAAVLLATGAAFVVLADPFGDATWWLLGAGIALVVVGALGTVRLRPGGLGLTALAVAVALVASGVVLASDGGGSAATPEGGGWIVLDGDTLDPPYEIEVTGLRLLINGHVVRERAVAEPEQAPTAPEDPRNLDDLMDVARAQVTDAGGPWVTDVPQPALDAVLADLGRLPGVSTAEWQPPFIVIEDTDGVRGLVPALQPAPATADELTAALEEEARAWRSLVDAGGGLLIDGGTSVELPPDQARGGAELIASGTHRFGRTPESNEAYLFTPFTAEGGTCHVGPMKEAARLHQYRVTHHDGAASTEAGLMQTSGRAGLLYVCAHGGYVMALHETRDAAVAARDELQRVTGIKADLGKFKPAKKSWWIVQMHYRLKYDGSGTIVWSDGCAGASAFSRAFFNARELIGIADVCYPGSNAPLHEAFWGRMDGTINDGAERPIGVAFAGMLHAISGFSIQDALRLDAWQQALASDPKAPRPRVPFTAWMLFGPGTSVLSPAVRGYSPDETKVVPLGLSAVWVQFDAPVAPVTTRRLVRAEGCGVEVRSVLLQAGGYTALVVIDVTQVGTVTFHVDPFEAHSQDAVELRLDGNVDPIGTDHVGPNGDEFTWSVPCAALPTTTTSSTTTTTTTSTTTTTTTPASSTTAATSTTTTTTSPSTTTTTAPTTTTTGTTTTTTAVAARRTLTVRAESIDQGELPADGISRNPDQPDYADGERVVLDAPASFTSGGFRHFFVEWRVSPRVDHAAQGTTLSVAMTDDVTVTAVYESTPE